MENKVITIYDSIFIMSTNSPYVLVDNDTLNLNANMLSASNHEDVTSLKEIMSNFFSERSYVSIQKEWPTKGNSTKIYIRPLGMKCQGNICCIGFQYFRTHVGQYFFYYDKSKNGFKLNEQLTRRLFKPYDY